MKALIIGLFCAALAIGDSYGQGKILIIASDSSGFSSDSHTPLGISRIQDALAKSYTAEVETKIGIFPDTLATYDAIFTDLYFYDGGDSLFIASELEKLTRYLSGDGKLYIQVTLHSAFYRKFAWDDPPPYSEYPPFREFVGLTQFGVAFSEIHGLENIEGIPGYFTDGLLYIRKTNPAEFNAPEILSLEGVTEILKAEDYPIGWQYEKEGAKVVWHWPIVEDHYDEFIGRVICNYFGLCEPLAVGKSNRSEKEFSVAYDPLSNNLIVENADGFSTLVIYNTLGIKVFESDISERTIELPNELAAGNYFVVATGVGRVSTKGIIVWK
jgi:hypothetical protein